MTLLVTLLFGAAALLSAAFGAIELRMLGRFLLHRGEIQGGDGKVDTPIPPERAPTVTIQIPLYNERTSAERIVRAAAAQRYPADRFDIQVLDDSTDETSEIVERTIRELAGRGPRIEHIRRSNREGYKAGALAAGLTRSEAEMVAVFDADFMPEPTFLSSLLIDRQPFDDPRVAFVQTRWAWGSTQRTGWILRALSLLLDRHFRVQKPTRAFQGNVTTFNGSGGIWRRAAIEDAGGWMSDTLTEDLDLSYRSALGGWRGRYLSDIEVLNELPAQMRDFKLQQRRWSKGTTQCLRKLLGRVIRGGDRVTDRVEEIFLLAAYGIHPLLFACLLLWPWAVLQIDRTLFWVMQAFMALGMTAAAGSLLLTVRERDGAMSFAGVVDVVSGIVIGVGLMVNNTVGQLQGLVATGGEFVRTPKSASPLAKAGGPDDDGGVASRSAPAAALEGSGSHAASGDDPAAPAATVPVTAVSAPVEKYQSALHWTFFLELAVAAYCLRSALLLVEANEALWAIAMVLWAFCVTVVAGLQLVKS